MFVHQQFKQLKAMFIKWPSASATPSLWDPVVLIDSKVLRTNICCHWLHTQQDKMLFA